MPRYATERELAIARRSMGEDVVVPPPPKKRKNEESIAQQAVIRWWSTACKEYDVPECLLFSIPNGGRRDPKSMIFLKREGLRPGIADLFLAIPRAAYSGLFLELKTATGSISDEQHKFIACAKEAGYAAFVCRSEHETRSVIEKYLTL